ncbi:tonsoku-like protein [Anopheles bellator]|uniref:tonsoku-like protein n=1 Tax=Anopheles bellator TaxID=139047 RepID=UPI00264978E0|nr:tonsoku-like protein [Anopheles bellator]
MAHQEQKLLKKKSKYAHEDNYAGLAETCQRLGELYQEREEHQRALNEFKLAAKAYDKLDRRMDRGLAYRMVGEMYLMMGQFKEALQNVQAYMREAQREGNRKELQRALVTIGRVHLHRAECQPKSSAGSDLKDAERAFRKSLTLCKDLTGSISKHNLMEMEAGIYLNLGITLDRQNKVDDAQEHMERAIKLAREADLFELLHTCYNTMALSASRWEHEDRVLYHGKTLRLLNHALEVASRLHNRASKMCQTLLLKSNFFLRMGDFQSARQTLKKAYRLKTPVAADALQVEKLLKLLVALCRTEDELVMTESANYGRRKALYERMGDGSCQLRLYTKAIDYYRRMLECAEEAGDVGVQLIPCYVSLYQTFIDNRQYEEALEFLWKEYDVIADEPKEAYQTLMQIAKIYERQKTRPFFDADGIYRRARSEAQKLGSRELERTALQRAIKLLRNNSADILAEQLEQEAIVAGIELTSVALPDSEEFPDTEDLPPIAAEMGDDGNEEEDAHDTPNIGDDIQLDVDLSDDSDSEQRWNNNATASVGSKSTSERPGATPGSRTRKRGTAFAVRRNNKGETQLHSAAISGNRLLAERLIAQGHPVNVRDHAGWLPLHEACIHGHAEIVALLLDHGSHLNDKGGTSCDGITPLYDACSNGRLDVIELLIERGANATQRTDFGDTALQVLNKWYTEQSPGSISSEECAQYKRIHDVLVAKFDAAAIQTSPLAEAKLPKTHTQRAKEKVPSTPVRETPPSALSSSAVSLTSLPRSRLPQTVSSPRNESAPAIKHRNVLRNDDVDWITSALTEWSDDDSDGRESGSSSPAGLKEYCHAMNTLRNANAREPATEPIEKVRLSNSPIKKRPAHMAMDEVDADDWLIDDMQQSAKRSRVSHKQLDISIIEGQQLRRSSSFGSPPPERVPSVDDDSITVQNHVEALYDSDTSEEYNYEELTRQTSLTPSPDAIDCNAFDVLIANSSKSFRRKRRRRNSSEHNSRRVSGDQLSLLETGFQRTLLTCVEEKENVEPSSLSPQDRPLSPMPCPEIAVENDVEMPVVEPEPPWPSLEFTLDNGVSITLSLTDVPEEKLTIGWLHKKLVGSYMMLQGKQPIIKIISVADNPVEDSFADSDPLSALIPRSSAESLALNAQIIGWKQINLEMFYIDYCHVHSLGEQSHSKIWMLSADHATTYNYLAIDEDFLEQLKVMDGATEITLQRFAVQKKPHSATILFASIFFQQDRLKELDLTMNGITDDQMEDFVRYLPSCKQLRVLRLVNNCLTGRSVELLCLRNHQDDLAPRTTTTDTHVTPRAVALGDGLLTELDLSSNSLRSEGLVPLGVLCSMLPNLKILRLRSNLIYDFVPSEHPLIDVRRFTTFDISRNALNDRSVECLLQLLVDGHLQEAHVNHLPMICPDFKPKLWQTICTHQLDSLRLLNLSSCLLSDDELESTILPTIEKGCKRLAHLDLSMNVWLTQQSFLALLRHCSRTSNMLEVVRFEFNVNLLSELETAVSSVDQLLQRIDFSPAAHYPNELVVMLPIRGYTDERRELLLAFLGDFWQRLWPTRQLRINSFETDEYLFALTTTERSVPKTSVQPNFMKI